ncbi:Altered inheritance of mitochondria protein 6 [Pleosporales sp. CAS-2024a]
MAGVIYVAFVGTLISRLAPPPGNSYLDEIVKNWTEPTAKGAFQYEWRDDFSRDIEPKNCHSHNDYWRRVPLYQALAAGCTSIEADVWLTKENELLVGHTWRMTNANRTLRSLYLDPLANIFRQRNVTTASTTSKEIGLFENDPDQTTVLLIDVKGDGHEILPVLQAQLQSFREKDWLTYYNGTDMHYGPLTVVGSGRTPFDLVQQNSRDRYVFYDAPLRSMMEPQYNYTNSYWASTNLKAAIGGTSLGHFSTKQESILKQQIQAARDKGLKSRYWDTPAWPISVRNNVWASLMRLGVGVLNVDDLRGATRWDWDFCKVAGIRLCGK